VKEPYLGVDWIDGYRLARISEMLGERADWDLAATQALQLDELSIPWRDIKDEVLAVPATNAATRTGIDLLREWDGRVSADSAGAAVFELFVGEMARRVGHLVELINNPPDEDWFGHPWRTEMAAAVEAAVRSLPEMRGGDRAEWAWGKVRPLEIKHPVGEQKPMDRVFNLGPFPWGGDSNTIAQTSVDPMGATNDPGFISSLRFVADVGNWDACEWILPAGQSGNPMSRHYDDQLALWKQGRGIPIPWTPEAVARATVATLKLVPARH
jgi:penicillin amidase